MPKKSTKNTAALTPTVALGPKASKTAKAIAEAHFNGDNQRVFTLAAQLSSEVRNGE